MKENRNQQLRAALSFAIAGSIPGLCLLLYVLSQSGSNNNFNPFAVLWVIIPGVFDGIAGFFKGAKILNQESTTTVWQAAYRGLFVALTAWFSLVAFLVAIWAVTGVISYDPDSYYNELSFKNLPYLLYVILLTSLSFGSLYWAFGVITGLILFKQSKSRQFYKTKD